MTGSAMAYSGVEELKAEFEERRGAIRRRLADFASVPESEYFTELVYCLLTPQSSAVNAGKAVEALRHIDTRNAAAVAALLHRKEAYIRFHNTKAKRVAELSERFTAVTMKLRTGCAAAEARAWLVANVKGLGWKEASHFLRNIGFRNLAILDRHILRNLALHGVIPAMPRTMNGNKYLAIEQLFARFAEEIDIPMDELDLLFWSRETGIILK